LREINVAGPLAAIRELVAGSLLVAIRLQQAVCGESL
jgi:hypothetical protein